VSHAHKWPPMLEQYFGMKARNPEALLLSRVGDFYEAYGEDAETVARALQIALTSKEAGGGRRIAMAGVPHHALAQYLAKLVAQRFVVALADQLEAPQPNKLVARDVTRVVTPGTLVEEQFLDGKSNNYLAALASVGSAFALAYADVSTGYCAATAFDDERAYDDAVAELVRIGPTEIIADLPPDVRAALAFTAEELGARLAAPVIGIVEQRARGALEGLSYDESMAVHRAIDALGAFVRRTSLASSLALTPTVYRSRSFLALDPATRKNLELTKAQGENPRATLLATLDCCATSMGSRTLARWLLAPLVDVDAILERQKTVAALLREHGRRDALRELLRGCFDLERIVQRVRFRRATPRDLASLRRTLELFAPLSEALAASLPGRAAALSGFDDLLADVCATLVDEPPMTASQGGVIRPSADAELGECVELRSGARTKIAQLEERERERTGIKSLKVKYANPFGYAIEISRSYSGEVPAEYVRKQTLASGERYITPELKELELSIATAQSRQERLEQTLYEALCERVAARTDALLEAARVIAEADVLGALAQCAAERSYVAPTFVSSSTLTIQGGRHPVMESVLHSHFVPNDVALRSNEHRFILLTGPNMGGKSTYLRQAGLLVIMAQIGSFVPAASMELGAVDRIFTRIGAGDDLAAGHSTFYMEMTEAAQILRRSTRRSLLLIDEVGRGTGTIDGLAIAQSICEYLLGLEEQAPMVLFATHFHELCSLAEHWGLVANYHITAVENTARGGAPVFSHRVQPGSSSQSFGIEVARMAGLPESVIERAREVAHMLSGNADVEANAPLRRRLRKNEASELQMSFLRPDG
jgi:DNA mismatch repair protein MutS